MKTKAKKISAPPAGKPIKVRLDYRTIIVLKHISALQVWLKKYPQAKVMAA